MEDMLVVFFTDDGQVYGTKYRNPSELKIRLQKDDFIEVEKRNVDDFYLLPKSKIRLIHVKKDVKPNGK